MNAWVDINVVFGGGWPPSEMDTMSIEELAHWWHLAHERNKKEQEAYK